MGRACRCSGAVVGIKWGRMVTGWGGDWVGVVTGVCAVRRRAMRGAGRACGVKCTPCQLGIC